MQRALHFAGDFHLDREAEGRSLFLRETDAIHGEEGLRFQRFLGTANSVSESSGGHDICFAPL
jgi:hypothetical protein